MNKDQTNHSITVDNRDSAGVQGVTEEVSYDENNIVMQTNMGQLTLDGSGLNIVKLNLGEGEVIVEGHIDAFYYMEQREKRSIFSGLFR